MTRKEELIGYIGLDKMIAVESAVDEFIFIENQLKELKKLPFIKINPKNPEQQKSTPAAKLYKELFQQYTNMLKVLQRASGRNDEKEESPLRKWVENNVSKK